MPHKRASCGICCMLSIKYVYTTTKNDWIKFARVPMKLTLISNSIFNNILLFNRKRNFHAKFSYFILALTSDKQIRLLGSSGADQSHQIRFPGYFGTDQGQQIRLLGSSGADQSQQIILPSFSCADLSQQIRLPESSIIWQRFRPTNLIVTLSIIVLYWMITFKLIPASCRESLD